MDYEKLWYGMKDYLLDMVSTNEQFSSEKIVAQKVLNSMTFSECEEMLKDDGKTSGPERY